MGITSSRRREVLSFGHHMEVQSLPIEEQDKLLDECEMLRRRNILKSADDGRSCLGGITSSRRREILSLKAFQLLDVE